MRNIAARIVANLALIVRGLDRYSPLGRIASGARLGSQGKTSMQFTLPPRPNIPHGLPLPDEYWQAVTDTVCDALAAGVPARSLFAASPDDVKPARARWWDWINRRGNESALAQYRRARELAADSWAEEVVQIADQAVDADTAAAARVRAEARKWVASKFSPKEYGDNVGLALGGQGGITINLQRYQPPSSAPLVQAAPLTIEGNSEPGAPPGEE